jgi:hypothetical protein
MYLDFILEVRNESKFIFLKEVKLEESRWKISYVFNKKCQLQPENNFTLKRKNIHSWICSSRFLNLRTHYVYHSTLCCSWDEMGMIILQHKHKKILGFKARVRYRLFNLQNGISYNSRQLYDYKHLLAFRRKFIKPQLMNGKPPGSIHACQPS